MENLILKHMQYLFILFFFLKLNSTIAQTSIPNTITAFPIDSKIKIDGSLDEPEWNQVRHISNFTQRELNQGEPATESTEFAIIYDKNNIYFGIWAYDSEPDKIIAKDMKHDFYWSSDDNFKIIICTFNDKRSGYLFVINPNGAYSEVLITDEGTGYNRDWNCVWHVKTEITKNGWFAEIKIPFSSLKFLKKTDQVWGINLERNIRRKKEQVLWQGWSRDYSLMKISQAGKLISLKNIAGEKLYEIKPYISAGIEKKSKLVSA